MARPIKNSCSYFPHDADMRNHKKIKSLRVKFPNGYAIWVMLIEHLTGSDGNVFEYSEMEFELMSGDFGFNVSEITGVIDYCIKLEMLFNNNGFIHSPSLDERLEPVYKKRNKAKELSAKQLRSGGKFTSNNNGANGVTVTETPQSKVNKSKVNKSRGDERKKTESPPPTKDSYSKEGIQESPPYSAPPPSFVEISVKECLNEYRGDMYKMARETLGMSRHIDEPTLIDWAVAFSIDLTNRGVIKKTVADFASHFSNWIKYQDMKDNPKTLHEKDKSNEQSTNNGYSPKGGNTGKVLNADYKRELAARLAGNNRKE